MLNTNSQPDFLLAQVRVLRLTDRLLEVAQELRDARHELDSLIDSPDAKDSTKREASK